MGDNGTTLVTQDPVMQSHPTSVQLPPKDDNSRSMARNTNTGVCSLGPALYLVQTLGHYAVLCEQRDRKSPLTTRPKHQLLMTGVGQEIGGVYIIGHVIGAVSSEQGQTLGREQTEKGEEAGGNADVPSLSQQEQQNPC